eukprot:10727582-Alexandrium_andersonii.AAC.1
MEVGALEPEPPEGDIAPRQVQAAFELLRRAAYRPGKASGKGGKPGALWRSEIRTGPRAKARGVRVAAALGKCWKCQEAGHKASECPHRQQVQNVEENQPASEPPSEGGDSWGFALSSLELGAECAVCL